jgi:hypothetical protein
MDNLTLLRKAVEENVLEDAPLAALVDELLEQGYEWEASVWQAELEWRRSHPEEKLDRKVAGRQWVQMILEAGPGLVEQILACRWK